jgi:hypothetical protein
MDKRLGDVGKVLFFIAWINFAVFWVVAVCIGGDAISGKAVNGHFYVSSHGKLTEVSRAVWNYSRIHTMSIWITHPIGIFGGGGLMVYAQRKKGGQPVK